MTAQAYLAHEQTNYSQAVTDSLGSGRGKFSPCCIAHEWRIEGHDSQTLGRSRRSVRRISGQGVAQSALQAKRKFREDWAWSRGVIYCTLYMREGMFFA